MLRQLRAGALMMLMASVAGAKTVLAQGAAAETPQVSAGRAANRAYFGQDMFIPKGQTVHDATCVFCSVQVEGDVGGRVLVLFGNLSVSGHIEGGATVVGGNAVFDAQAHVLRTTAVMFGNLVYETEDVLAGSAYVLGGHSSSYGARHGLRRRFALSPGLVTTLALL